MVGEELARCRRCCSHGLSSGLCRWPRRWPDVVPCSVPGELHSFAVAVDPRNLPQVSGLERKLSAWLCAALSGVPRRRAARRRRGASLAPLSSQALTEPVARLRHAACLDEGLGGRDGGADAGLEVEVTHADTLLAPRRSAAASAHAVLHHLMDIQLRHPGAMCEAVVRLMPITAAAPVAAGTNFDNLWFVLPSLLQRVPVHTHGGDHPFDSAFLEVFSCVCWETPLQAASPPAWDLEAAVAQDGDVAEHAAEAARAT
mmetsp:Transcript_123073/g.347813  ORF Transcript_123073/g.347813 Transcript_123073/m.347813 type:complete len:258 (-) Transcript_123073:205-978(-)